MENNLISKIPISICLYTSTKGHFGRFDCFHKTVESLLSNFPKEFWGGLFAHIKIGEGDTIKANEMVDWLKLHGFTVFSNEGNWSHGQPNHQIEYLRDMSFMINKIKTTYYFHLEDDMLIKANERSFEYWVNKAVSILEKKTDIVQIRIPRFINEFQRILNLKEKHGIDGKSINSNDNDYFFQNDWSNNPFIVRTRDFRSALYFLWKVNVPKHSEHGLGMVMKLLSDNETPFVCLNPKFIRCYHFGTPAGEEDDLNKELNSN